VAFGISAAIAGVRAKFKRAYSASVKAARSIIGRLTPTTSGSIVTISQKGLEDASGVTGALFKISVDGSLSNAVVDAIGQSAVEKLKDAVDPITRTGTLRDSFRYENQGKEIVVYSTASYAKSITSASSMRKPPSAEELMDWMKTKAEFAGLDPKDARRVAFAIRNSIKTGTGSGRTGRSDIRRLSPSGERAYDYVSVAVEQLSKEIGLLGLDVVGEVVRGA